MPETITIPSLGQVACAVCSVCRSKIYPASALRAHLAHHQSRGWRTCASCAKTYHKVSGEVSSSTVVNHPQATYALANPNASDR